MFVNKVGFFLLGCFLVVAVAAAAASGYCTVNGVHMQTPSDRGGMMRVRGRNQLLHISQRGEPVFPIIYVVSWMQLLLEGGNMRRVSPLESVRNCGLGCCLAVYARAGWDRFNVKSDQSDGTGR